MSWSNRKNLTEVLKYARTISGMTQLELAKKLKTKQSAIARLESGKIRYHIEFAEKWAQACGLEIGFQWINLKDKNSTWTNFYSPL